MSVVIDIGSSTVKCGLAGDIHPRVALRNVATRKRKQGHSLRCSTQNTSVLFGEEALASGCAIDFLMEEGRIVRPELQLQLLKHAIDLLGPRDASALTLLDGNGPVAPLAAQLAEWAFESLGFDALRLVPRATAQLTSSGKLGGLVVDIGGGMSTVTAVVDGFIDAHTMWNAPLAGDLVSSELMRSLNRDHAFSERQLLPLVETLKQDLCFLSPSYSDFSNVAKRTHFFQNRCRFSEHRMPDGQLIRLNSSQFDCAEVLISPGIACLDLEGIPQGILRVIEKAPLDLRLPLVQSLSFYGGGSKLTGLPSRVSDEVTRLYNTSICHETRLDCLMVSLPQHAEESAFLGASCIANLEMETSQSEWLAREQWQEIGSCRAAGVMCASRFGEGS